MIISVFIPHGGCPERCAFCDQKTSGGTPVPASQVARHIDAILQSKPSAAQIAFYGATFTALPRRLQESYLGTAKTYIDRGLVRSTRVSTRPDAVEKEWLAVLREKYFLRTVEIGVQSFDPEVLRRLHRSHSNADVFQAMAVLRELRLEAGAHLMVGTPGERPDADIEALEQILRLRPDFVRIHPLLVFRGTALGRDFSEGKFEPITLEQAVERCAFLTEKLESGGIPVHRLGLQPNEAIPEELLAGPYHPAFGELVRSRIWRRKLSQQPDLAFPRRLESQVRGKNNCNIRWLEKYFHLPPHALSVVQASDQKIYEEMRIFNSSRTAERGQIQLAQQAGRKPYRHRHPQSANDALHLARVRPAGEP